MKDSNEVRQGQVRLWVMGEIIIRRDRYAVSGSGAKTVDEYLATRILLSKGGGPPARGKGKKRKSRNREGSKIERRPIT